jgi:hypothetical protein
VQWVLRPSDAAGQYYIVSLRDGRRLRSAGGAVDFAPPHVTDSSVRWNWIEDQHGWFYIENPAAPATSRRLKDSGGVFSMVSNGNSGDAIKWRFIVPSAPLETDPPAQPTSLLAEAGDAQVSLSWSPPGSADLHSYTVYRRLAGNSTWAVLTNGITTPSQLDSTALNGTTYEYGVSALDLVGYESELSNLAEATPIASTPTELSHSASSTELALSWPASHTGWILQTQTNDLGVGLGTNWFPVLGSEQTNHLVIPIDLSNPSVYYRLISP